MLCESKRPKRKLIKAYEETARLIKEICDDFAAWNTAREYQIEDVVRIVHQFLIGSTGVMNANEMSLGKTFESIVALYIIRILFEQKHNREADDALADKGKHR